MSGALDLTPGVLVEGRELGFVHGDRAGPTLLCVAGLHGNEPAGVHALRRVLDGLGDRGAMMTGDLVALAGNTAALAEGRRFIDRDLNRAWTRERLAALRADGGEGSAEDHEQLELLAEIEWAIDLARGPVYALDLHTTSGPGGIFSAFSDALPPRDFAKQLCLPMIFGLEELVEGTLLNQLSEQGLIAVTVETGQHDEPDSVDRAEAAVWIALVAAGLLPEEAVPEAAEARDRLRRDTGHLPRALEMRYRRAVVPGDGFAMEPGYTNFEPVASGDVIARDNDGPVVVDQPGRLLMPLYQEQGEDGYFLVREFAPFWMAISYLLRRARLSRFVHWLPGVERIPGRADELRVDKRVARFFAKELFHLLGYRSEHDTGDRLIMRRRPFEEPAAHRRGRRSDAELLEEGDTDALTR